ncbi:MAG TPA: YitT family protein [Erysipelotrichaceae bacterium]|nr:YitT family protein [Erysipelotrichaceae bacterium]
MSVRYQPMPFTYKRGAFVILGSILYALSVNIFLTPLKLYAGGIVGLAQLIKTLGFSHVSFDLAGMINLALNIPLFILAYKAMNKRMFFLTLLSVGIQTLVFSLAPIPLHPLLDDKLANIFIAGLLSGAGCGIVLTNGGSAGGLDLLGVYLTEHFENFSVGIMNLSFNAVLYTICAILFNLGTAIYSIIFVATFALAIDRMHYQNVEIELMIFTHHPEIAQTIMHNYTRGVTAWEGTGAYTNAATHVFVTVVAKDEVKAIKKDILAADPKAFIIAHENIQVTGGYIKHLI